MIILLQSHASVGRKFRDYGECVAICTQVVGIVSNMSSQKIKIQYNMNNLGLRPSLRFLWLFIFSLFPSSSSVHSSSSHDNSPHGGGKKIYQSRASVVKRQPDMSGFLQLIAFTVGESFTEGILFGRGGGILEEGDGEE